MTALPSSAVLLLLCLSLSSFLFAASTDDVASIRISAEQYQTVNVPLPEEAGKTINMDSTSETGTLDLNVPLSSPSSSAPSLMSLGVCYYPEQWAQRYWEEDIRQMKQVGIKYVRLGEFFWIMDREHVLDFSLFDHVLNLLDKHGIQAILSTPTATPPRWLIKEHPEVLPTDINNLTRKFGSRRHYSFSSDYRSIDEVNTVISALASRYAQDTRVAGWQLDNEYGCHDTVRSYGPAAKRAFQKWLAEYYHHNITALNTRWGNTFWSMDYDDWSEIELPNNAVTVSNPSHWLSFYRFSSDQLISFNKWQVEIFREHMNSTVAPQFLTTNLMGFFFNFDAYALSADLDMIVWDSYPLGFTDSTLGIGEMFTPGEKVRYARTGHVDLASFHHSLYRNMHQRMPKAWGIMEQQPGPGMRTFTHPNMRGGGV